MHVFERVVAKYTPAVPYIVNQHQRARLLHKVSQRLTFVRGCLCTVGSIWPLLPKIFRKLLRDLSASLKRLSSAVESGLENEGLFKWRSSAARTTISDFLLWKLPSRFLADKWNFWRQGGDISSKGGANSYCIWNYSVENITWLCFMYEHVG